MIPKKVGKNYGTQKKEQIFTYKDVQYNEEGWVDAAKYLPGDCDMMYLDVLDKEIIPGWIHGIQWQGLRLRKNDVVVNWKRKPEEKILCI